MHEIARNAEGPMRDEAIFIHISIFDELIILFVHRSSRGSHYILPISFYIYHLNYVYYIIYSIFNFLIFSYIPILDTFFYNG
jgi:hypothetical protein